MAAAIDFAELIDDESPQSEKDIVEIFEHVLTSSSDPATATARIIDDVREYFWPSESERVANGNLWILWMNLLALVMMVPIDHPWHRVFIDVVDGLRRRGGAVTEAENVSHSSSSLRIKLTVSQLRGPKLLWEDLPNLRMYVFDKWADPSELEDCEPEDISAWKRFNSFACQLLTRGFAQWTVIPYWEIRFGLETAPEDAVEFEVKLWVATEWLIKGAPFMYREMTSTRPLDEEEKRNTRAGPLCKDLPGVSLERWAFWRSRLSEIASMKTFTRVSASGSSEQAAFSDESYARVAQAIAALDAAEKNGKDSKVNDKGTADVMAIEADVAEE
ncbi:hypothetical protein ASPVEDRAFT_45326 [Aspergillus versicolor CBS 583.65]|uniref:Uncharacterized protein n=1 Tax=Aspergillus versicolor CBS 583.65 TaxID=1036611 RepID=A0A1L9PWI1_ASPVE|nr:uncharacterized protein ASPVEDRAFT_45326 [Aspergillus versicolor CBS 583.65]OJJ05867.1 hypothetical protein ASPVEDRAFT_45326 [Aspergillus versicolor CBS 583.65]